MQFSFVHGYRVKRQVFLISNGLNMGGNGDPLLGQQLQADASHDAQGRCETAGQVPSAGGVLGSVVLDLGGVVPVAGPGTIPETGVVLRPDVPIGNDSGERGAAGDIPHETREKFRPVLLPPRRGGGASARGTPV